MQYFQEYAADTTDSNVGKFIHVTLGEYYIQTNSVYYRVTDTNRAIHGDIVFFQTISPSNVVIDEDECIDLCTDQDVIESDHRPPSPLSPLNAVVTGINLRTDIRIIGILQLLKPKIIGSTSRGVRIYEFNPCDWHYPPYYVASKFAYTLTNPFIVFHF